MAMPASFIRKTMESNTHTQVTGIILAGGNSRRMGTDKGLMQYNGRPMVEYSIELLQPFCADILLVTANPAYEVYGLKTVTDIFPGAGPLGGLHAGLTASSTEINFCLSCDMPHMQRAFIQRLITLALPGTCIVPVTHQPQPLAAIYPRSAMSIAESNLRSGNYRMTDFLSQCNTRYIAADQTASWYNENTFRNINSPDDLKITP